MLDLIKNGFKGLNLRYLTAIYKLTSMSYVRLDLRRKFENFPPIKTGISTASLMGGGEISADSRSFNKSLVLS